MPRSFSRAAFGWFNPGLELQLAKERLAALFKAYDTVAQDIRASEDEVLGLSEQRQSGIVLRDSTGLGIMENAAASTSPAPQLLRQSHGPARQRPPSTQPLPQLVLPPAPASPPAGPTLPPARSMLRPARPMLPPARPTMPQAQLRQIVRGQPHATSQLPRPAPVLRGRAKSKMLYDPNFHAKPRQCLVPKSAPLGHSTLSKHLASRSEPTAPVLFKQSADCMHLFG